MRKWPERVLYIRAIKALPERFVHIDTLLTVWDSDSVIVANPKYSPMIYLQRLGKWKKLKSTVVAEAQLKNSEDNWAKGYKGTPLEKIAKGIIKIGRKK